MTELVAMDSVSPVVEQPSYRFDVGAQVVKLVGSNGYVDVVDKFVSPTQVMLKGSNAVHNIKNLRWAYKFESLEHGGKVFDNAPQLAASTIRTTIRCLQELPYLKNSPMIKAMVKKLEEINTLKEDEHDKIFFLTLDAVDAIKHATTLGDGYIKSLNSECKFLEISGEMDNVQERLNSIRIPFTVMAKCFSAEGHSGSTYNYQLALFEKVIQGAKELAESEGRKPSHSDLIVSESQLMNGQDCAFSTTFSELEDAPKGILYEFDPELLLLSLNVLRHMPMSKLTYVDEEFMYHGNGVYQNIRYGSVFKDASVFDGKPYFLDAILFSDNSFGYHEAWHTRSGKDGTGSAQALDVEAGEQPISRGVYIDVSHLNLKPGYGPDEPYTEIQYKPSMGKVSVGNFIRKWDMSVWQIERFNTLNEEKATVTLKHVSTNKLEDVDLHDFHHGVGEYGAFKYPLYHPVGGLTEHVVTGNE